MNNLNPLQLNDETKLTNLKEAEAKDPQSCFETLIAKMQTYINDPAALSQVEKAYLFAKEKHKNQVRTSGEPYITHPLSVAIILTDLKVDVASIISAILHDVVEDTDTTLEMISSEFGSVIAELVDGLTKIRKIKFRSSQERMAENFRKMVLAMAKDLRVILIKLADRLHNMRTLDALSPTKRNRIANETLDIYAPLASRLGIYGIKSELEDLCLKVTKNEIYKEISRKIAAKKKQRQAFIEEVKQVLEDELQKSGFKNHRVYGRPKHFYSIYKKMVDRQLIFEDIHDLFAFRIVVETVKDCYEALGIVHAMWRPMPGRFKDYIAMPKANLYQSLHTTVLRPNGTPAEIQIRTYDMHNVCEYGIAAHWSYKEKTNGQAKAADLKKFSWLRQIMELQHDVKDPNEFLDAVKVDLFEEEIFVFTPKGDVIQLNQDATPLDFAFAVHTDVGLHTVGAKVNGKITPLRAKVKSGDIVEVITSANQKPSKDWLNFVTTSKAKNKIRSFLRGEQRDRSKKIGSDLLSSELAKHDIDLGKLVEHNKTENLFKAGKESNFEDLLISIGYGKTDVKELIAKAYPRLNPPAVKTAEPERPALPLPSVDMGGKKTGVLVSGLDNILVTFGRCCNPLPGESIVGFITRGRGVSIHRANCKRALDLDPARQIETSWEDGQKTPCEHTAYLKVVTHDRQGILADITVAISKCDANIQKAQVKVSADMMGISDFQIRLRNLSQLQRIISNIEAIQGVVLVERKDIDPSLRPKKKKGQEKA